MPRSTATVRYPLQGAGGGSPKAVTRLLAASGWRRRNPPRASHQRHLGRTSQRKARQDPSAPTNPLPQLIAGRIPVLGQDVPPQRRAAKPGQPEIECKVSDGRQAVTFQPWTHRQRTSRKAPCVSPHPICRLRQGPHRARPDIRPCRTVSTGPYPRWAPVGGEPASLKAPDQFVERRRHLAGHSRPLLSERSTNQKLTIEPITAWSKSVISTGASVSSPASARRATATVMAL
jgi:hypothetical protein